MCSARSRSSSRRQKSRQSQGRYICLLRGKTGEENHYFAKDSIVELAKMLGGKEKDWAFVENALLEKGIYKG